MIATNTLESGKDSVSILVEEGTTASCSKGRILIPLLLRQGEDVFVLTAIRRSIGVLHEESALMFLTIPIAVTARSLPATEATLNAWLTVAPERQRFRFCH